MYNTKTRQREGERNECFSFVAVSTLRYLSARFRRLDHRFLHDYFDEQGNRCDRSSIVRLVSRRTSEIRRWRTWPSLAFRAHRILPCLRTSTWLQSANFNRHAAMRKSLNGHNAHLKKHSVNRSNLQCIRHMLVGCRSQVLPIHFEN